MHENRQSKRVAVVKDKNDLYFLITLITGTVALLAGLIIFLCVLVNPAQADPPHPKTHYKWEVWPNGNVILFFLRNGAYERYVYKMVHEVEPAVACSHKFDQAKNEMKLITFDTSMPYWYTLSMEPILRWDVKQKKYIEMKGAK